MSTGIQITKRRNTFYSKIMNLISVRFIVLLKGGGNLVKPKFPASYLSSTRFSLFSRSASAPAPESKATSHRLSKISKCFGSSHVA